MEVKPDQLGLATYIKNITVEDNAVSEGISTTNNADTNSAVSTANNLLHIQSIVRLQPSADNPSSPIFIRFGGETDDLGPFFFDIENKAQLNINRSFGISLTIRLFRVDRSGTQRLVQQQIVSITDISTNMPLEPLLFEGIGIDNSMYALNYEIVPPGRLQQSNSNI